MDVDLVLSVDLLSLDLNRSRSRPGVADRVRRGLNSTNSIAVIAQLCACDEK